MLESDWLTNVLRCAIIFRETHGERRPHYSSVSLRQMISVISKGLTTAKQPKPTTTLAKYINIVSNGIKTTDHFNVFATKLRFMYVRKTHTLFLPLSLPYCGCKLKVHDISHKRSEVTTALFVRKINLKFRY